MTLDVKMPMMSIETIKTSYAEEARISVLEIYSLNCKNNLQMDVILANSTNCRLPNVVSIKQPMNERKNETPE